MKMPSSDRISPCNGKKNRGVVSSILSIHFAVDSMSGNPGAYVNHASSPKLPSIFDLASFLPLTRPRSLIAHCQLESPSRPRGPTSLNVRLSEHYPIPHRTIGTCPVSGAPVATIVRSVLVSGCSPGCFASIIGPKLGGVGYPAYHYVNHIRRLRDGHQAEQACCLVSWEKSYHFTFTERTSGPCSPPFSAQFLCISHCCSRW